MFQYEYEKSRDWNRVYPSEGSTRSWPKGGEHSRSSPDSEAGTVSAHSRRALPLPPRPTVMCTRVHTTKPTVPLKVWIIASASCFAVCAALVLATVVITKWGTSETFESHSRYFEDRQVPEYSHEPHHEPVFSKHLKNTKTVPSPTTTEVDVGMSRSEEDIENDIQFPILEKISIFKNMVANRDRGKKSEDKTKKGDTLVAKQQIHPAHDTAMEHSKRKIEKKDQAKHPDLQNGVLKNGIPEFKPTLPDVFVNEDFGIELPDGFEAIKNSEYDSEYYYNDDSSYDDYMQTNTMTSYLIEKVQELHDWITSDSDFQSGNNATRKIKSRNGNEFSQVLKALNESLIEGNVTIIMNKLKDIYFGENYTNANHSRKVILSNSTDLLSFGILSLDVMLLHNIQLMAWENQESARNKMLKDPDVFAFNALFLDPAKVEAKHNEVFNHQEKVLLNSKRQSLRQESDDFDLGRNLLENVLEMGMSTARAAIHLGRAYKNTKMVLSQLSNKENINANIQNQLSRNIDANSHALNRLQTSYNKNDSLASVASNSSSFYTELDCVWLLYCKNLVATAKLNPPYGVMARINGMALRMLTGELSADRALDTMLYEALTGWTDLRCQDMFPRCSKVNAAAVVMESIRQPLKKQSPNKAR